MSPAMSQEIAEGLPAVYVDRRGHRQAARTVAPPRGARLSRSVFVKLDGSPVPAFEARLSAHHGDVDCVEISRESLAVGEVKREAAAAADRRRRDLVARFLASPEAMAGRSLSPAGGSLSLIPTRDQQRELQELGREYAGLLTPQQIPYFQAWIAKHPEARPVPLRWEPEAAPAQAKLDEGDTPGRIERYARRRGLLGSATPERIIVAYARDKARNRLDE